MVRWPLSGLMAVLLAAIVLLAACEGSPAPQERAAGQESAGEAVSNGLEAIADAGGPSRDSQSWERDKSPFTFTQYFYGNWATNYLWRDQYAMKLVTEKTGVRIDRKLAAGSDEDYLNMLISTGELPDSLMLDWNSPAVAKLIDGGLVYSMTELIDEYAPEFWQQLNPEMVKYHSVNGKLWYLPNLYEDESRLTYGSPIISIRPWFIRRDIYEALGSPRIETTDELKQALLEIKQQNDAQYPLALDHFDVAKNGFGGSLSMDYLIYSFAPYLAEERIRDDRQEVLYPMRSDGFIDAFRYLNGLFREGLFDPKFLITKQAQYEEGMYRAEYAVASQFLNGMYTQFNPIIAGTIGEDRTYVVLDGLRAGDRVPRFPASRLLGWQGFFITKKAKDPERILRFAEYAWSDEGQLDFQYGKEGETYEIVDGLPRYVKEVRELMNTDYMAWQHQYGFEASTLLWRSSPMFYKAELREMILSRPDEYNASMKLSRFNYDDYALGLGNLEPEGSTPEGVINANIKTLWNKAIPHLVMAVSEEEFDKAYGTFIKQMEAAGAQKVEREMYQRHLADLKKKGIE
jgi:putative aldouronate transport system substrate-binding protein